MGFSLSKATQGATWASQNSLASVGGRKGAIL